MTFKSLITCAHCITASTSVTTCYTLAPSNCVNGIQESSLSQCKQYLHKQNFCPSWIAKTKHKRLPIFGLANDGCEEPSREDIDDVLGRTAFDGNSTHFHSCPRGNQRRSYSVPADRHLWNYKSVCCKDRLKNSNISRIHNCDQMRCSFLAGHCTFIQ